MILTPKSTGHRADPASVSEAVNRIIAERCDNYTSGDCYSMSDRTDDAPYIHGRTCYACQFKRALGLVPSRRYP